MSVYVNVYWWRIASILWYINNHDISKIFSLSLYPFLYVLTKHSKTHKTLFKYLKRLFFKVRNSYGS